MLLLFSWFDVPRFILFAISISDYVRVQSMIWICWVVSAKPCLISHLLPCILLFTNLHQFFDKIFSSLPQNGQQIHACGKCSYKMDLAQNYYNTRLVAILIWKVHKKNYNQKVTKHIHWQTHYDCIQIRCLIKMNPWILSSNVLIGRVITL